jgi:hypothetical protein
MPFMDMIIPESVDPTIRLVINALVGVHILAFLIYVWLLLRSSNKSEADVFRDQYKNLEKKVQDKQKQGKQE